MFWDSFELAVPCGTRNPRVYVNAPYSRPSITMSTLGLQIRLVHGAWLLNHRSSLSRHSLHTLRCYARFDAVQTPTCQPSQLKGLVRRSGTLSNAPSAPPTTWVDRLPESIRPYLYLTRIDKPIGTLLLYYPCSGSLPSPFPPNPDLPLVSCR